MDKRLKNQKADIKYIRSVLSRLPDDMPKSVELTRFAFIEKGITKGKFSVLNLKDLSNLGVDIKILSKHSATPRSVNVALGLKSNKDKTSTARLLKSLGYLWYVVVSVFLVYLVISFVGDLTATPYQKCSKKYGNEAISMCKEDGSVFTEFELQNKKQQLECANKGEQWEWIVGSCRRVRYDSKQDCMSASEEKGVDIEGGGFLVTRCRDDGTYSTKQYNNPYDAWAAENKTTCLDVTSYDQNWNNDMLCTNPDGSQFYTSYDGARVY